MESGMKILSKRTVVTPQNEYCITEESWNGGRFIGLRYTHQENPLPHTKSYAITDKSGRLERVCGMPDAYVVAIMTNTELPY